MSRRPVVRAGSISPVSASHRRSVPLRRRHGYRPSVGTHRPSYPTSGSPKVWMCSSRGGMRPMRPAVSIVGSRSTASLARSRATWRFSGAMTCASEGGDERGRSAGGNGQPLRAVAASSAFRRWSTATTPAISAHASATLERPPRTVAGVGSSGGGGARRPRLRRRLAAHELRLEFGEAVGTGGDQVGRRCQPSPSVQLTRVTASRLPRPGRVGQVAQHPQRVAVFGQPCPQPRPVPDQRFMGDLDRRFAGRGVVIEGQQSRRAERSRRRRRAHLRAQTDEPAAACLRCLRPA